MEAAKNLRLLSYIQVISNDITFFCNQIYGMMGES